ncbi:MAG: F0F1 ATP synthase subunit alpha, partial [Spirosomaceae bacterium]|nr:F0F1 ATP synthase subunit alpha [Spirosomataceae bacterium]
DPATQLTIDRGRRNQEILKQAQFSPSPVGEQVAMIYGSINGIMDKVPVERVKEYEAEFLTQMNAAKPEYIATLAAGKLDDEITDYIKKFGRELAAKYAV